jgi:hypothetical protein
LQDFCDRIVERGIWPPWPPDLRRLTSFCGDFLKEESAARIQEAWRTLQVTLNRLLPALTNSLWKVANNTVQSVNDCLQKGEAHFQHLL